MTLLTNGVVQHSFMHGIDSIRVTPHLIHCCVCLVSRGVRAGESSPTDGHASAVHGNLSTSVLLTMSTGATTCPFVSDQHKHR